MLGDRYTLLRELGVGGMATVWLARDLKHDRDVAVKILRHDLAESIGRERFLREIQLAAKLTHPHILPVHDSGEADGVLFYVMPNVTGQSLRDRMNAERLPVADAVRVAREVAGALDYAHRQGVVHRDIKPENIMLLEGHAMVADFGIGKALSAVAGDTLTQVGMSVGTPAYMSPEQAVGETVDGRSDIYSLGCVLYEMLVGEPPFTGPNVQAVIAKRFVQTPPEVTALREGVPRSVARAVQTSLARTPVDRYQTAAELVAALTESEMPASRAANAAPAQSVAVLPFANLSQDPENEFFGDGIAEDIINALAQIDGLHVAARTSAFSFKGKRDDLRAIGEKLNVATVLEGSVRRSGSRLRITAQLIAVDDGYHLWSERFDRDLVDVFAVQDEIASAIASKLQLAFHKPANDGDALTPAQAEVYELYLKGRVALTRRGLMLQVAIECFERAVALDPDHAKSLAALGEALRLAVGHGLLPARDGMSRSKAALHRALQLDPMLGEALGSMGSIAFVTERDPGVAIALWERALAANPMLSEVRSSYANFGLFIGRGDEARAIAEMRRAVRDDPLNATCNGSAARLLAYAGHSDEARSFALRALELDPQSYLAHLNAGTAMCVIGDMEAGQRLADRALQLSGRDEYALALSARAAAGVGDHERALSFYHELRARAGNSTVSAWARMSAAIAAGEFDDAMTYALQSVEANEYFSRSILRTTSNDPLRSHPRFEELRRSLAASISPR